MTEPEIVIRPDPDACSRAAAERIANTLAESIAARGNAHWVTTGGSTPLGIYRILAVPPLREEIDWAAIHLWWGDDRYVGYDHPLSNVKPAADVLLRVAALRGETGAGTWGTDVVGRRTAGAPIPADQVHRMPMAEAIGAALGPEWVAQRYAKTLRDHGPPVVGDWPAFDLVLLGIGSDGHVLSVFPGSVALTRGEWALAIPAPTHIEPRIPRVTLNPGILESARQTLLVSHGVAKAGIVGRVFGSERDPSRWPAQLARRAGATWILDEAAAAGLPN